MAITNLAKAIRSDIPITKSTKALATEKSDIYNVELKVDTASFFGELTIISFLINTVNADLPNAEKFLSQGTDDLNFDNLLYSLNNRLRPVADAFAITAKNSEPAKD